MQYINSTSLFRPPYGRITKSQIKQIPTLNFPLSIIMWNILAGDWEQSLSPHKCFNQIKNKIYPGAIVVFHDSDKAKERMKTMVATGDGFKISEKDLELRGPGDIEGTRQSGLLNFKLANIINDKALLEIAKQKAMEVLTNDEELQLPGNMNLKQFLGSKKGKTVWSKIS